MTQKTFAMLWWSSLHLAWADHVFKVVLWGDRQLCRHVCYDEATSFSIVCVLLLPLIVARI